MTADEFYRPRLGPNNPRPTFLDRPRRRHRPIIRPSPEKGHTTLGFSADTLYNAATP